VRWWCGLPLPLLYQLVSRSTLVSTTFELYFFRSRFTISETLNYLWISTTWCNTHSVQDQLHFSDYAKRPSDSVHSYRPLCTTPRGKTLECNHATTALHSFYSAAQLPANRVSRGAPTYVTPRRTKRAETKLHFGPTRSTIGPNEAPPRRRSQWDSVCDSPSDLYISTHSHSVNGPWYRTWWVQLNEKRVISSCLFVIILVYSEGEKQHGLKQNKE